MDKASVKLILCFIGQPIAGFLLFLIGSGFGLGKREILFFTIYFGAAVLKCVILRIAAPERLRFPASFALSARWTRLFPLLLWLAQGFAVYLAGGIAYKWLPVDIWFYIGLGLFVLAELIVLWAHAVNAAFLCPPGILPEGSLSPVAKGPYSIVRHPACASVFIRCLGLCLVFPHLYVAEVGLFAMLLSIILTALEDRALIKTYPEYSEYAQKVEFRLIPYLW